MDVRVDVSPLRGFCRESDHPVWPPVFGSLPVPTDVQIEDPLHLPLLGLLAAVADPLPAAVHPLHLHRVERHVHVPASEGLADIPAPVCTARSSRRCPPGGRGRRRPDAPALGPTSTATPPPRAGRTGPRAAVRRTPPGDCARRCSGRVRAEGDPARRPGAATRPRRRRSLARPTACPYPGSAPRPRWPEGSVADSRSSRPPARSATAPGRSATPRSSPTARRCRPAGGVVAPRRERPAQVGLSRGGRHRLPAAEGGKPQSGAPRRCTHRRPATSRPGCRRPARSARRHRPARSRGARWRAGPRLPAAAPGAPGRVRSGGTSAAGWTRRAGAVGHARRGRPGSGPPPQAGWSRRRCTAASKAGGADAGGRSRRRE